MLYYGENDIKTCIVRMQVMLAVHRCLKVNELSYKKLELRTTKENIQVFFGGELDLNLVQWVN